MRPEQAARIVRSPPARLPACLTEDIELLRGGGSSAGQGDTDAYLCDGESSARSVARFGVREVVLAVLGTWHCHASAGAILKGEGGEL